MRHTVTRNTLFLPFVFIFSLASAGVTINPFTGKPDIKGGGSSGSSIYPSTGTNASFPNSVKFGSGFSIGNNGTSLLYEDNGSGVLNLLNSFPNGGINIFSDDSTGLITLEANTVRITGEGEGVHLVNESYVDNNGHTTTLSSPGNGFMGVFTNDPLFPLDVRGTGLFSEGVEIGTGSSRGIFDIYNTTSIGNVSSPSLTINYGSGSFYHNDANCYFYSIYAAKLVNGTTIYSQTSADVSDCDNGNEDSFYTLGLSWTAVTGADKYKIVVGEDDPVGADTDRDFYVVSNSTTIGIHGLGDGYVIETPIVTPKVYGPNLYVAPDGKAVQVGTFTATAIDENTFRSSNGAITFYNPTDTKLSFITPGSINGMTRFGHTAPGSGKDRLFQFTDNFDTVEYFTFNVDPSGNPSIGMPGSKYMCYDSNTNTISHVSCIAHDGTLSSSALTANRILYSKAGGLSGPDITTDPSMTYSGSTVSFASVNSTNPYLTNGQKVGLIISTSSPLGTAYTLTTTTQTLAATSGAMTSSMTVTLTSSGTYSCSAVYTLFLNGATFAASRFVTSDVYRQNNTPGVVAETLIQPETQVSVSGLTSTFGRFPTEDFSYTTTNTNDVLSLHISIDTAPGAGSIQAKEAKLRCKRDY